MVEQAIKTALKERNWTKKDLAETLGIGHSYLCSLIRGRFNFTKEMLLEIHNILGIPKEELGFSKEEDLEHENKILKNEIKELKLVIRHLANKMGDKLVTEIDDLRVIHKHLNTVHGGNQLP
jgi:transcriptional regulator with XRE-family HTH domain